MTRRRVHDAARAGFTLFEILIALAVTAAAFGGIYTVTAACMDMAAEVERKSSLLETGRLVLGLVSDDLRCMVVPPGQSPAASLTLPAADPLAGEDDERVLLELTTAASLGLFGGEAEAFPRSAAARVRYVLVPPRDDDPLFDPVAEGEPRAARLVRRECPFAGFEKLVAWREVELADNVESLNLEFLDPSGTSLETSRADADKALSRASALRVALTLVEGESRRDFFLRVGLDAAPPERGSGQDQGAGS